MRLLAITIILLASIAAVFSPGRTPTAKADTQSPNSIYLPLIITTGSGNVTPVPPTPTPTQPPFDVTTARAQVITAVNSERAKIGCAPVVQNAALTSAAQAWNDYMVSNNFFNHSVNVDANWYANHGYIRTDWVSESLAEGQDTGDQAVALWMQDEGHKATVLLGCTDPGSTVDIGVGVSFHVWVLATGELHN